MIYWNASQRSAVQYSEIDCGATGETPIIVVTGVAIVGTLCTNIGVAVGVVSLQTSSVTQIVSSEEVPIVAGRAIGEI